MQNDDKNLLDPPPPDYRIVLPDRAPEELAIQEQTQDNKSGLHHEDYITDLKPQLKNKQAIIDQVLADKRALQEKYDHLEAKSRTIPTENTRTIQGTVLRTKIVVNQLFREVLQIKGWKNIYANILIDATQNKYIRLEPIPNPIIDHQARRKPGMQTL